MEYTSTFTRLLALGLLTIPLAACPSDDGNSDDDVGTEDTDTSDTSDTSDTTDTSDTDTTGNETPAHCEGADAWTGPADDGNNFAAIQGLFSDAEEGHVLCLDAGDYSGITDEIIISTNNVTIIGAGEDDTVLDFADQSDGGNGIKVTADGVSIQDLQVKNTPGDGIRGDQVDDITFTRVKVLWESEDLETHGAYGLYPVGCNNVAIIESTVIGSRDAGHYVGQSNNVVVRDSVAYQNVAGVEIENCFDSWVFDNEAYDNTAGLLVFDLPGLEQGDGGRTRFYNNTVTNNNIDNFAIGGTVAMVPSGTGALVLAANDVEIDNNTFVDHKTSGIIVVHYASILFGDVEDETFDLWNRGIGIHDNEFTNTGYDPDPLVAGFLGGAEGPEFLWDGAIGGEVADPICQAEFIPGEEVCARNNTSTDGEFDFFNLDLCGNYEGVSDPADIDCEGPSLGDWPG